MALEPAQEKGLWTNPDCPADGSGVHALIIGVSRYDHFQGGSAPAPDSYGLGQLGVSALTAYRFFEWLRETYVLDGWPVARVRLLLSPQRKGDGTAMADELDGCDAATCAHAPEATFDNCKDAIERWYADMDALKAPAAGRSLFLFSGHGMELRQNLQLLLPNDYLRPPGRLMNNAISTRNLSDALSYLGCVSSHVLLLDGCRSDVDKLRGAQGTPILNDQQSIMPNPQFEKGALSATASGLRAYSPRSGGLSLFGQALLDGLRNKPQPPLAEAPIELRTKGRVATIEINKLASYMKRRVAALIENAGESVLQVVRSEVASPDPDRPIDLAQIRLPLPAVVLPALDVVLQMTSIDLVGPSFGVLAAVPTQPPDASGDWFRERYRPARPAVTAPPDAGFQAHVAHLHTIFGSEAVTYPWVGSLRVVALSTRQASDHRAIEIVSSAQAAKMDGLHRVQISFRVAGSDPLGHLMTIEDGRGRSFCSVLPGDFAQCIFQLEIDVEDDHYVNFATYLSPSNDDTLGRIASAWETLRARDPLAAVRQLDVTHATAELTSMFVDGEVVLQGKLRSPVAAAVAAVLLLKGNQFARMHDWARNLATWFPALPDGVVLWTEQCRRMAAGKPLDPALLSWFVREMSRRALPFTADGFGLAADLADDIARGRLVSDASTRAGARALADRLGAASPYFRDSGMFCTFTGFAANWDAVSVLGPPSQ